MADGLFAHVGVGHGKELTCLLLPDAMNARRAVILTEPRLCDQMLNVDIPRYGKHFRLPLDRIDVIPYSSLSIADKGDVLERLHAQKPIDLIICNEAHNLKNVRSSARAKRARDFRRAHLECRWCVLTGTPGASVRHYGHLLDWSLGESAPLPRTYHELEDWARALDAPEDRADAFPLPPGALVDLVGEVKRPDDVEEQRDLARQAYQQRFVQTVGVVTSADAKDCNASLVITARKVKLPPVIQEALKRLRERWIIGDDELWDASQIAQKARQLACGFYYRWDWPGGEVDVEWLQARSAWNREVRKALRRQGLYSPLMVERAAERGELGAEATEAWRAWKPLKGQPEPPKATEWLSDFFVDDVLRWIGEGCSPAAPGVVWYEHIELEERFRAAGLEVFGRGKRGDQILTFRGVACAASMVHATGKNLQHFNRALVTTSPAGGERWQQLLGRLHRAGQRADVIDFEVYQHEASLISAFSSALEEAHVIETREGERQKLVYAMKIGFLSGNNAGESVESEHLDEYERKED